MKSILVTGSTDGIGQATAGQLVQQGHLVLVHGRTQEKAKLAASKVKTQGAGQALPVWGDLSIMSEVVELANQVKKAAPELDVLINNAGVYMNQRKLSKDGFEMTFCVNHLAVHLLTHELIPTLEARPRARVVTVSSIAHQRGHLDFDNLNSQKHFDGYEAYSSSKLCNVLFTRALAAILKNSHVTANCLHPGVIDTKLLHAGFQIQGDTTAKGSENSVFLALDPSMETTTGGYYVNCKLTYPSRLAQDDNLAVQLWKKSEELLKPWLS